MNREIGKDLEEIRSRISEESRRYCRFSDGNAVQAYQNARDAALSESYRVGARKAIALYEDLLEAIDGALADGRENRSADHVAKLAERLVLAQVVICEWRTRAGI